MITLYAHINDINIKNGNNNDIKQNTNINSLRIIYFIIIGEELKVTTKLRIEPTRYLCLCSDEKNKNKINVFDESKAIITYLEDVEGKLQEWILTYNLIMDKAVNKKLSIERNDKTRKPLFA